MQGDVAVGWEQKTFGLTDLLSSGSGFLQNWGQAIYTRAELRDPHGTGLDMNQTGR